MCVCVTQGEEGHILVKTAFMDHSHSHKDTDKFTECENRTARRVRGAKKCKLFLIFTEEGGGEV